MLEKIVYKTFFIPTKNNPHDLKLSFRQIIPVSKTCKLFFSHNLNANLIYHKLHLDVARCKYTTTRYQEAENFL